MPLAYRTSNSPPACLTARRVGAREPASDALRAPRWKSKLRQTRLVFSVAHGQRTAFRGLSPAASRRWSMPRFRRPCIRLARDPDPDVGPPASFDSVEYASRRRPLKDRFGGYRATRPRFVEPTNGGTVDGGQSRQICPSRSTTTAC